MDDISDCAQKFILAAHFAIIRLCFRSIRPRLTDMRHVMRALFIRQPYAELILLTYSLRV